MSNSHFTDEMRGGLAALGERLKRLRGGHERDPLEELLVACLDPAADELDLLKDLYAALRPARGEGSAAAVERFNVLITCLREDPVLAAAFRRHYVHFFTRRHLRAFFADSGILPATGFFSEWARILVHRVLPEVPNKADAKACIHIFLNDPDDWVWLSAIPEDALFRFWQLLAPTDAFDEAAWKDLVRALLDAISLLAHRVAGLGMDSALLDASAHLGDFAPSFFALPAETECYTQSLLAHFADPTRMPDDGKHLLVIVDQCLNALTRARKYFLEAGTSLHMTYLLMRCEESLYRMQELIQLMQAFLMSATVMDALVADAADTPAAMPIPGGRFHPETGMALRTWGAFVHRAFLTENRRNNFGDYWARLMQLLALRVTETAAQSGGHYICTTPREYRGMWLSAMGAGVLIAGMALLKIFAGALHTSLFATAVMYSLIYGLGFTVIYLLGFTVATKQPAMTAQTLVSQMRDVSPDKADDLSAVVDLIAAVCRSQMAAIAGNILVAFPVAIALGVGLGRWLGESPISAEKSAHLLSDLDIFGWALPHAALAGVFLYLAGLISGYFDNRAAHSHLRARIAYAPWLRRWLGEAGAARLGDYIGRHLGGIMGNFLFGCMLGCAGIFGVILGLPIDIRHIAFSAANMGYAIIGSNTLLSWQTLAWAALGVLLIGMTNLLVSFTLALRTAFRARHMTFKGSRALLGAIWQRFRETPGLFFLPPHQTADKPPSEGV